MALVTDVTLSCARVYHGYVVGSDGFPSVPGNSDDFKFWNIVCRMSPELQEAIQTAGKLRAAHCGKHHFRQMGFKHYQRLKEESEEGFSTLLLTNDCGLQLIIIVMRINLQREDDRVLVLWGQQHMGQLMPNYSLPRHKLSKWRRARNLSTGF